MFIRAVNYEALSYLMFLYEVEILFTSTQIFPNYCLLAPKKTTGYVGVKLNAKKCALCLPYISVDVAVKYIHRMDGCMDGYVCVCVRVRACV